MALPLPAASVSPNQVILPKKKKVANELKITPITKEALWESSIMEHHVSSLVPLAATLGPSHTLMQLQVVTKSQVPTQVGATP